MKVFQNIDCMEGMKEYPDNYFDLCICDPPYGINIHNSGRLQRYNKHRKWDSRSPNQDYFNELFRVSQNQIIWGGNYFDLPPTKGFAIWDKKQPAGISFASCEFAWSSFIMPAKTYRQFPVNIDNGNRIHPTQKPIKLYKWLLHNYAKAGDKILDTHVGSGSSLIACSQMDFDYVGYEIDKDYYDAAVKRINEETRQFKIDF